MNLAHLSLKRPRSDALTQKFKASHFGLYQSSSAITRVAPTYQWSCPCNLVLLVCSSNRSFFTEHGRWQIAQRTVRMIRIVIIEPALQ